MKKNILSMLACLGFAGIICGDASAMNAQDTYAAYKVTSKNADFSVFIKALVPADDTPEEAQRVEDNKNALNQWVETFRDDNGDRANGYAALDAILTIAGLYKNDLTLDGKLGTDRVSANLFTAWRALDGKALTLTDAQDKDTEGAVFKGLSDNDIIAVLTGLRDSFYSQEFVAERLRSAAKAIDANVENVLNYLLGLYTNEDISKLYVVKEGKTLKVQQDAPAQDPQTVKEYVKDLLSTYGVTADDYIKFEADQQQYITDATALLKEIKSYGTIVDLFNAITEIKQKAQSGQLGDYLNDHADSLPFFIKKGNNDKYKFFERPELSDQPTEEDLTNALISKVTLELPDEQEIATLQQGIKDDLDVGAYFKEILKEPAYRAFRKSTYDDQGIGTGLNEKLVAAIAALANVDKEKVYTPAEIVAAVSGIDFSKIEEVVTFLSANRMPDQINSIDDTTEVKKVSDLLVAAGLLAQDKGLKDVPNKGNIKFEELRRDRKKIYDSFSQVNLALGSFASANVSSLAESFKTVAEKLGMKEGDYNSFAKFDNVKAFIDDLAQKKGLTDLAKSLDFKAKKGLGLGEDLRTLDSDPSKLKTFLTAVEAKYNEARNLRAASLRYQNVMTEMKKDEAAGYFTDVNQDEGKYQLTPAKDVIMKADNLEALKQDNQFKEWVADHAEDFGVKAAQQPIQGNLNGGVDKLANVKGELQKLLTSKKKLDGKTMGDMAQQFLDLIGNIEKGN